MEYSWLCGHVPKEFVRIESPQYSQYSFEGLLIRLQRHLKNDLADRESVSGVSQSPGSTKRFSTAVKSGRIPLIRACSSVDRATVS
jgi:hypothetical protein